ncbi:hypothetical protein [Nostoc cycadae]|uniref:Uncharacterized protein n=1 Tax=Nostoc cycadae WK-1 TaxID=1861711 RepID=A0A2H6LN61_9NOSO|nr:hypothetical protein [Nostoc cycadae]GBE94660.1 hypothetical protein NCWK1_4439 [Nostoc cycadae WK-1]
MNNQNSFDDELLKKRIDTFYGYGNYQGNYWFIGMEEAGGDFKDVNNRINIWDKRGLKEIDDVAEYHIDIGWPSDFQPGAAIQPTWKGLIRIVLSAKGKEKINLEDVRQYQIQELGRKDKETCLLELLPLPAPSLKHWIYNQHSHLSYLFNRQIYESYCLEKRINYIAERIKEHKPEGVVFYGKLYEYSWREITKKITDIDFKLTSEGFLICRTSQTMFVIAKHPVAFGSTNQYFHNIGRAIAARF